MLFSALFLFLAPSILALQPSVQEPFVMGANDDAAGQTISDIVGSERQIGIFASMIRDIDTIAATLGNIHANATVLAPSNLAMSQLDRKPWEDPKEYQELGTNAYDGAAGQDRAHRNVRKFVEAHIVPLSPLQLDTKMKTVAGTTIWLEKDGNKLVIKPDKVEMVQVAQAVSNGELWVINSVLNYAE